MVGSAKSFSFSFSRKIYSSQHVFMVLDTYVFTGKILERLKVKFLSDNT